MNAPRTSDQFNNWICTQIKNLVTAFGVESSAEVLGHSSGTIRKTYQVNEARSLTLKDTLYLEREMAAIGLEPSLSKAHLEACGYEVRKKAEGVARLDPAAAAMNVVPVHCDSMKEIVQAAEDGEISPKEHERIKKSFEQIKVHMRNYDASYNASQRQMAAE
ncbi:hypothetical protein [Pseudovibrio ascidiaceicola]|uniref:hypothetical protein n=1 Tax=Pseudovibrio ascidiaceicola TaxID=285279 RepID=UPI000D694589|nr:hypothetical protein [Pseudovibrio ascidiaceicola]